MSSMTKLVSSMTERNRYLVTFAELCLRINIVRIIVIAIVKTIRPYVLIKFTQSMFIFIEGEIKTLTGHTLDITVSRNGTQFQSHMPTLAVK